LSKKKKSIQRSDDNITDVFNFFDYNYEARKKFKPGQKVMGMGHNFTLDFSVARDRQGKEITVAADSFSNFGQFPGTNWRKPYTAELKDNRQQIDPTFTFQGGVNRPSKVSKTFPEGTPRAFKIQDFSVLPNVYAAGMKNTSYQSERTKFDLLAMAATNNFANPNYVRYDKWKADKIKEEQAKEQAKINAKGGYTPDVKLDPRISEMIKRGDYRVTDHGPGKGMFGEPTTTPSKKTSRSGLTSAEDQRVRNENKLARAVWEAEGLKAINSAANDILGQLGVSGRFVSYVSSGMTKARGARAEVNASVVTQFVQPEQMTKDTIMQMSRNVTPDMLRRDSAWPKYSQSRSLDIGEDDAILERVGRSPMAVLNYYNEVMGVTSFALANTDVQPDIDFTKSQPSGLKNQRELRDKKLSYQNKADATVSSYESAITKAELDVRGYEEALKAINTGWGRRGPNPNIIKYLPGQSYIIQNSHQMKVVRERANANISQAKSNLESLQTSLAQFKKQRVSVAGVSVAPEDVTAVEMLQNEISEIISTPTLDKSNYGLMGQFRFYDKVLNKASEKQKRYQSLYDLEPVSVEILRNVIVPPTQDQERSAIRLAEKAVGVSLSFDTAISNTEQEIAKNKKALLFLEGKADLSWGNERYGLMGTAQPPTNRSGNPDRSQREAWDNSKRNVIARISELEKNIETYKTERAIDAQNRVSVNGLSVLPEDANTVYDYLNPRLANLPSLVNDSVLGSRSKRVINSETGLVTGSYLWNRPTAFLTISDADLSLWEEEQRMQRSQITEVWDKTGIFEDALASIRKDKNLISDTVNDFVFLKTAKEKLSAEKQESVYDFEISDNVFETRFSPAIEATEKVLDLKLDPSPYYGAYAYGKMGEDQTFAQVGTAYEKYFKPTKDVLEKKILQLKSKSDLEDQELINLEAANRFYSGDTDTFKLGDEVIATRNPRGYIMIKNKEVYNKYLDTTPKEMFLPSLDISTYKIPWLTKVGDLSQDIYGYVVPTTLGLTKEDAVASYDITSFTKYIKPAESLVPVTGDSNIDSIRTAAELNVMDPTNIKDWLNIPGYMYGYKSDTISKLRNITSWEDVLSVGRDPENITLDREDTPEDDADVEVTEQQKAELERQRIIKTSLVQDLQTDEQLIKQLSAGAVGNIPILDQYKTQIGTTKPFDIIDESNLILTRVPPSDDEVGKSIPDLIKENRNVYLPTDYSFGDKKYFIKVKDPTKLTTETQVYLSTLDPNITAQYIQSVEDQRKFLEEQEIERRDDLNRQAVGIVTTKLAKRAKQITPTPKSMKNVTPQMPRRTGMKRRRDIGVTSSGRFARF